MVLLVWCFTGAIWFFISQNLYMFFQVGSKFGCQLPVVKCHSNCLPALRSACALNLFKSGKDKFMAHTSVRECERIHTEQQ